MAEGLATVTAFIGLFSCVGSLMLNQWCDVGEGFPPLIAAIGLLSSVDLMVFGQG